MQYKNLSKKDFEWISWSAKDIKENTDKIIKQNEKVITDIINLKEPRTFKNTFYPLDAVHAFTEDLLSPIHFIGNSSTKKSVRTASVDAELKIANTLRKLYRNKDLFEALKSYKQSSEKLTDDKKLFVKDTLKGFKKMGLHLPIETQKKLVKLSETISKKSNQYRVNLNDYKDGIWITKKDTEELPKNYVSSLKKKDGKYWVSLEYPDLGPFLKLSSNERLREKLLRKAHKQGGKKNMKLLQELAELRLVRAKLLGFETHAEAVLEHRMAKKPETVITFLKNLEDKIAPAAKKDLQLLQKRKKKELGNKSKPLAVWDTTFYANKLLQENFNLDTEKLREYFPLEHTLTTMLKHFGDLFGVEFKITQKIDKLHKDIYWLEVREEKNIIAYITLDFFPRPGKFTHMAMFNIKTGYFNEETGQFHPPVVGMLGNFAKPTGKKPALLSLGEVTTLFHEFGHLLHGAFTRAKLASHAGTSVAWDFVEVPSQVIQQWAEDTEFIAKLGKHYETDEAISKEILESLDKAEKFLLAFGEIRQNFQAQYDMAIHHTKRVPKDINVLWNKMYKSKIGLSMASDALYPASFGHLAESYDAGYYSYKWSEVYAIDIYSEFKKKGLSNKQVGKRYRNEILAYGSSRDEMKSLKAFLGRNPNNKAFLKKIGLEK